MDLRFFLYVHTLTLYMYFYKCVHIYVCTRIYDSRGANTLDALAPREFKKGGGG